MVIILLIYKLMIMSRYNPLELLPSRLLKPDERAKIHFELEYEVINIRSILINPFLKPLLSDE